MAALLMLLEKEERQRNFQRNLKRNRILRESVNPFELAENKFIQQFKVSKEIAKEIIGAVKLKREATKKQIRRHRISDEKLVLVVLQILGRGEKQATAGLNGYIWLSQRSVSRAMKLVLAVIVDMFSREISFPCSATERKYVSNGFQKLGPFEGVLGAIDCSYMDMEIKKTVDREEDSTRKHSISVQMLCDADLVIRNLETKHPGQSAQSIFDNCPIKEQMERLQQNDVGDFYLIGDHKYKLDTYLLTPQLNSESGTAEDAYNKALQSIANVTMKRCIEVLESRFPILRKDKILNYSPETAATIMKCCAILHNKCIRAKLTLPSCAAGVRDTNDNKGMSYSASGSARATLHRQKIIQKYFSSRQA